MQVKAAKMAELLQDTRRRRTSASLKLRVVIGTVTESVEAVNEIGPTEQAVARHKVQLEESWRLYDLAFFMHLDLLDHLWCDHFFGHFVITPMSFVGFLVVDLFDHSAFCARCSPTPKST